MGEALISRAGGGGSSDDIILVPLPGYHSIGVTLKTEDGRALSNALISCKDGNSWYNYTTNEKGQCTFVCNSGAANISVGNNINGIQYIDILPITENVDAPVGLTSLLNLVHPKASSITITGSRLVNILVDRIVDLYVVGGGGGGAGGLTANGSIYDTNSGGGGAGYLNTYLNINLNIGQYNFICGGGGAGGNTANVNRDDISIAYGSTGGTSYIVNTNYSAIGGEGGLASNRIRTAGIGGLGNGGGKINYNYTQPENSSIDFAGGGGGQRDQDGGSPYGGKGTWMDWSNSVFYAATAGQRGGGGGGGYIWSRTSSYNRYFVGAMGGTGLFKIDFK